MEISDNSFAILPEFNLEQYWIHSVDQFIKTKKETEMYPVLMKISKGKEALLKRFDVLEKLGQGDDIKVKVNMHGFELACTEVMPILWDVEIIEPGELRHFIKDRILHSMEMYFN